jgi:hypothetical protein
MLYATALVAVPLLQWTPHGLCRGLEAIFRRLVTSACGPLVWSAMTALTLVPMSIAGLDTSTSFTPPVRILMAYGVFFVFGWLLFTTETSSRPSGVGPGRTCWPGRPAAASPY